MGRFIALEGSPPSLVRTLNIFFGWDVMTNADGC